RYGSRSHSPQMQRARACPGRPHPSYASCCSVDRSASSSSFPPSILQTRREGSWLLGGFATRMADNPEASGALDQFRHRSGPHLQHDLPALFLDRRFRGAELAGDLLVEEAGDDSGHHVAFARGQGLVPATKLGDLLPLRSRGAIALDRVSNGVEEILLAKRFRQELDRTGFHGPNRHGDVAVTGEKDDGQRRVRTGELALKLEAAEPRESYVEDEAPRRNSSWSGETR